MVKKNRRAKRARKKKQVTNLIMTVLTLSILVMVGIGVFEVVNLNTSINKVEYNDIDIAEDIIKEDVKEQEEIIKIDNSGYLLLEEDPNADDAKVVEGMLNTWDYIREDGKKIAYLTFDDGPSDYVTPEILDVLNANDVKATFFVLGSMIEKSNTAKAILKRMVNDGHAIGNHGYCHKYDVLYPNSVANPTAFINDMKKSEDVMKSVLGKDFHTRVLRLPGGHSSWYTDELDQVLESEGYVYVDWNSLNGDAESHDLTTSQLVNRLEETVSDLYGNDDVLVILMHDIDIKESTAKSLQATIDYLKSLGYEFKTLK